jgi:hypothetical protein
MQYTATAIDKFCAATGILVKPEKSYVYANHEGQAIKINTYKGNTEYKLQAHLGYKVSGDKVQPKVGKHKVHEVKIHKVLELHPKNSGRPPPAAAHHTGRPAARPPPTAKLLVFPPLLFEKGLIGSFQLDFEQFDFGCHMCPPMCQIDCSSFECIPSHGRTSATNYSTSL